MRNSSMNIRKLHKASTDENVSAIDFIPFVRECLNVDDPSLRSSSIEAFVSKAIEGGEQCLDELRVYFAENVENPAESEYLLKVAGLGILFVDEQAPNRDIECAQVVHWLIENDPTDPFLENPFCYDFSGKPYETVKEEWLKVVNEHPGDVRVLANAAEFVSMKHPEMSRVLFERCRNLEPNNPDWSERITDLER